jgi:hypothetical protein
MEEVLEECSEKIGENDPDEEAFLRGIWRRATIGVRPGDAQGLGGREDGQASNLERVYVVTYAELLGARRSTGPRPAW